MDHYHYHHHHKATPARRRRTSVDLLETVPHQWGIGERESKAMENNEKAYHQMASANLISMQLANKA